MRLPVNDLRIFAAQINKYSHGCNMRRLVDDGFKGTLLKRKQGSRRRECCIKRDSRLINVEASKFKKKKKKKKMGLKLQSLH